MFFYSKSTYRSAGTKKTPNPRRDTLKARTDNYLETPVTSPNFSESDHTRHRAQILQEKPLGQLPSGSRCGPWNAPVLELAVRCWWSQVAEVAPRGSGNGCDNGISLTAGDLQGPELRQSITISPTNGLQLSSCPWAPLGHIVLPSKGWHNVLRDRVAKESKHWWQQPQRQMKPALLNPLCQLICSYPHPGTSTNISKSVFNSTLNCGFSEFVSRTSLNNLWVDKKKRNIISKRQAKPE